MKKSVLFVCLGNICRSPAAEAVLNKMAGERGMADLVEAGSAGTGGWMVGKPPDPRMKEHARRRGYELSGTARKFDPLTDFGKYNYIIGMDEEIIKTLKSLSRSENDTARILAMTDFCHLYSYKSVPDPYYGGEEGFELVMDLLEDACEGLLEKIAGEASPEILTEGVC